MLTVPFAWRKRLGYDGLCYLADVDESLRDAGYVVLRKLGEGSQAATLEENDTQDGRVVAIKRFEVREAKR